MSIKDQAICIRTIDYSETSQIVTFFTKTYGKISVLAKGSKRPKSSFGGAIEVFSYGGIVFIKPSQGTLATLTEFQAHYVIQRALSTDLFALHACLFAAELLNKLTREYDPHSSLYDAYISWMRQVSGCDETRLDRHQILALLVLFQLTLLRDIGLGLELKACVNCRQAFHEQWQEYYISSMGNGLLCRDCEGSFTDKLRLTQAHVQCLTNPQQLVHADKKMIQGLISWFLHHFTNLLHHRPKTAIFITEVNK